MKNKTFLVTGGAGFLGSHLTNKLLQLNNNVLCFDDEFRGSFKNIDNLSHPNLTCIKGSILNLDNWPKYDGNIDGIFHLAAINGTPNFYNIPEKVLNVNVLGTINALEYVRKHDIPYFSFASTPEAYGIPSIFPTSETEPLVVPDVFNPRWSYGGSKIIGEIYCSNYAKKYNFKCSIIRYNNSYGPHDHSGHVIPDLTTQILRQDEIVVEGTGDETRSFCYVSDTINGALLLYQKQAKNVDVYNIGTDTETKISELVSKLSSLLKPDLKVIYKPKKQAGTNRRLPDISKIRQLGFEPKISLDEGLKTTLDWLKHHLM